MNTLSSVKDRVRFLFQAYPETRESDSALLYRYEHIYGNISHQEIASVKRSSRYWRDPTGVRRAKYPDCEVYLRSAQQQALSLDHQQEWKEVFRV